MLSTVMVFALILLIFTPITHADRNTFDELINFSFNSSPDSFQLANARALVAAFLYTGDSFSEIDAFLAQQRQESGDASQFEIALAEAKAGNITDVCIEALPAPDPVEGVNIASLTNEELERRLFGGTTTLRRAVSKELIRRLTNRIALGTEYVGDNVFNGRVFDIAMPFNSLYEVRVYGLPQNMDYETKVFDEYKFDLLIFNIGKFVDELEEESGPLLAKVYYAEFLVFWAEDQFNRNYAALYDSVSCDSDEE
jgi:hypothetical protein